MLFPRNHDKYQQIGKLSIDFMYTLVMNRTVPFYFLPRVITCRLCIRVMRYVCLLRSGPDLQSELSFNKLSVEYNIVSRSKSSCP